MRTTSASKNRWGASYKPFFDGTDLTIHNANLSKAARTFFDFALTKLDGKRCNRMTIPLSDTEFAKRFNYSETRARHARRECVNAGLFEQYVGRTKSGTRLVGKFCLRLVLPDESSIPIEKTAPPPPQEDDKKVVESQTDLWSEANQKSGQLLTGCGKYQIPQPHAPTEFDEHADPDAIDVALDICIDNSLSSVDTCNVNSKPHAQQTRERRADKMSKSQESTPVPANITHPIAEKFIAECMGRSRVPKEIFQRVTVEMDATVSDIKLDLGIGHDKAIEVAQNACDALVENIERVRSLKMFDETDYWQKAIDKAKNLFSYPTQHSSAHPCEETQHLELVSEAAQPCSELSSAAPPPTPEEINAELLATWDDDRWLDWVDQHVDKCVRIRQTLCQSPIGADLSPYTDAEITVMRDELLTKYPETDEQRLEWIGNRISEQEEEQTNLPAQLTATKPKRETVPTAQVSWQQQFSSPTAYIIDYCQQNRHRKTLSPIEIARLFRAVEGQVTPDEIESIQHSCYQNWRWEKKNDRFE